MKFTIRKQKFTLVGGVPRRNQLAYLIESLRLWFLLGYLLFRKPDLRFTQLIHWSNLDFNDEDDQAFQKLKEKFLK
jgi:hypothetical protein